MSFQEECRNKDDILNQLHTLDYYCKKEDISAELVMMGGSAILTLMELNGQNFRPTMDIDINIINTMNKESFYKQLEKVKIDVVGGVMEVPPLEDFEFRNTKDQKSLYELEVGFEAIRVFLPNLELLACCKIFSTRLKDLRDLEEMSILDNCNKDKLLGMVEEYKQNLLNPANPDLNVHQLDRIFEQKGI
ncbi:DUF6036 family nucleotidyltransferase [Lentibacillus sp. N15]|uniref:DUF6036 family nucleotidyltransferase n=1 Tax=Lentibacillus songyuanensis TaxID=3136161 RepID=UPI0031BB5D61